MCTFLNGTIMSSSTCLEATGDGAQGRGGKKTVACGVVLELKLALLAKLIVPLFWIGVVCCCCTCCVIIPASVIGLIVHCVIKRKRAMDEHKVVTGQTTARAAAAVELQAPTVSAYVVSSPAPVAPAAVATPVAVVAAS